MSKPLRISKTSKKLIDAMEVIRKASSLGSSVLARDILGFANDALALPQDDAALQARLAEEREKCAEVAQKFDCALSDEIAEAIRGMT